MYLGGGTPSLWSVSALKQVLVAVGESIGFGADAEVTIEANPSSIVKERILAWRSLGVNRVSLGVQSFNDGALKSLGRKHSSREALAAIKMIRDAGFSNLALDLIQGAPEQTLAMAREDVLCAVAQSPQHLSIYALTLDNLEIEVPLAKKLREGKLQLPNEEVLWQMTQETRQVLKSQGWVRYEISNWSQPGLQSRHNALYWTGGQYLGLGCGACGFTFYDRSNPSLGGRRWGNYRSPEQYIASVEQGIVPEEWSEHLDASVLLKEILAIGTRQVAGIDVDEVCRLLQQDSGPILEKAGALVQRGLARVIENRVVLTERGLDFHNEAALIFV